MEIHVVSHLDLPVADDRWEFSETHAADIAQHFATVRQRLPAIFDGRVLLMRDPQFDGDRLRARYFETRYSNMLAWRDWGFPDKTVYNGFGMAALLSADGAFLLGEMGPHTANAGRVYFPAGTADPVDVFDGRLDQESCVKREFMEEVGIAPHEYTMDPGWTCVRTGQRIAMIRVLRSKETAAALRERIHAHFVRERQPELSAVVFVADPADITPAMPDFVTAFLHRHFGGGL